MNVTNSRLGSYFHRLLMRQRRTSTAGQVFSGVVGLAVLASGVYQLFAERFTENPLSLLNPSILIALGILVWVDLTADLLHHRNLRLAAALRAFIWLLVVSSGVFVMYRVFTDQFTTWGDLLKLVLFALIAFAALLAIHKYGWENERG